MGQAVAPRRVPNRSCVACRTVRPKRELMRVVRTSAGVVTVDSSGRAAGRGAYVCRTAECIATAMKKGALHRALRTSLPAELHAALEDGIAGQPSTPIKGGNRGQE